MPKIESGEYRLAVIFTRNYSDDASVLEAQGLPVTGANLVQQLRCELQMAYDHPDIAMAGSFDIVSLD